MQDISKYVCWGFSCLWAPPFLKPNRPNPSLHLRENWFPWSTRTCHERANLWFLHEAHRFWITLNLFLAFLFWNFTVSSDVWPLTRSTRGHRWTRTLLLHFCQFLLLKTDILIRNGSLLGWGSCFHSIWTLVLFSYFGTVHFIIYSCSKYSCRTELKYLHHSTL